MHEREAGRPAHAPPSRAARCDELLASGRFARGRVSAQPEGNGVLLVVRVVPAQAGRRARLDLHGARVDHDELLRDADLAEGGEIVGADIDAITAMRIERTWRVHGYPSAHAHASRPARHRRPDAHARPRRRRARRRRASSTTGDFYVFGARPRAGRCPRDLRRTRRRPDDRADSPPSTRPTPRLEQALHSEGLVPRHGLARPRVGRSARAAASGVVAARARRRGPAAGRAASTATSTTTRTRSTAALGLDTETDRSPSHLADKLRAFYEKRGFLDVEVRAEVRGARGPASCSRRRVFHIDEHPRVRVAVAPLPVPQARRDQAALARRAAVAGRDRHRDRQLPRGGAARRRPARRPRPARPRAPTHRRRAPARARPARRPVPLDLEPDATYVADTYDRAVEHVQELYRNEGFLHAAGRARAGRPRALRPALAAGHAASRCRCRAIAAGDLHVRPVRACPLPTQPLDPSLTCRPDPGARRRVRARRAARHPGQARAADAALGRRVHGREER